MKTSSGSRANYLQKRLTPAARPRERVLNYLNAEYTRPDAKGGSRLPTIRQLAQQLKVSDRTVLSVFRKLNQEGRIRSRVGQGTFLVSRPSGAKQEFRIAINMADAPPPYDEYTHRIYAGILRGLADLPSLSLIARNVETIGQNVDANVDGLILFPVRVRDQIRVKYEQIGKKVVDINPPSESATANFVSADYFESSRKLAEVWRETGRQHILLLLGFKLEESVSGRLRRYGIEAGLGHDLQNGTVTFRFEEAGHPFYLEEAGYATMQRILARAENRPDAVLCMGDFLALGVVRAATEAGLKVPEDISIVGGTGNDLTHSRCPLLTRSAQPMVKLGEEAIKMIWQRLIAEGVASNSVAGKILAAPFVGGGTTRPEENRFLSIPPLPEK